MLNLRRDIRDCRAWMKEPSPSWGDYDWPSLVIAVVALCVAFGSVFIIDLWGRLIFVPAISLSFLKLAASQARTNMRFEERRRAERESEEGS